MSKVTIKQIAANLGVSTATVSIVLNAKRDSSGRLVCSIGEETAERVLNEAKRLGYRPNRAAASLRTGKWNTIGVIVTDVANHYFSGAIRYIEDEAMKDGYLVVTSSSDEKLETFGNVLKTYQQNGIAGIIMTPCPGSGKLVQSCIDTGIPVVMMDRYFEWAGCGKVSLDNIKVGRMAVEHLVSGGYRKIEMISYFQDTTTIVGREIGYMKAMENAGLQGYVRVHRAEYGNAGDFCFRAIEDAIARGTEAMFIATNTLTRHCIKALTELRVSVPDQLAVVCFDESDIYQFFNPTITYIRQSCEDMGRKSVLLLKDMLERGEANKTIVLEPEMIYGDSSRPKAGRVSQCSQGPGVSGISQEDSVLLSGVMFGNTGGWTKETQFISECGSSYLVAHGLSVPVEDASTVFHAPASGKYHIAVRSRNWTGEMSDAPGPGQFRIVIDGRSCGSIFGDTGKGWKWYDGGHIYLSEGNHNLAVHDITGLDARFDSVLLTLTDYFPDDSIDTVWALRNRLSGSDSPAGETARFDVVVAGEGLAAECAAIAAARRGMKVALISGRKVLGGDNSSEVRLGLYGKQNLGPFPSLGYLLNEFAPAEGGDAGPASRYGDEEKMEAVLAERNITLFLGYAVRKVLKSGLRRLNSVEAVSVEDYSSIVVPGDIFIDCTDTGLLGTLSGIGLLKSGTGDGTGISGTLQWNVRTSRIVETFPEWDCWADVGETAVVKSLGGKWDCGRTVFQAEAPETLEALRDRGLYTLYSVWSYMKNKSSIRGSIYNMALDWVGLVPGITDAGRIPGDVVLRQRDLSGGNAFSDACVALDRNVSVPFRCLYARDADNLLMAGGSVSISPEVWKQSVTPRFLAMTGEAAGLAAAVCREHGLLPGKILQKSFDLLGVEFDAGAGRTNVPYRQTYDLDRK